MDYEDICNMANNLCAILDCTMNNEFIEYIVNCVSNNDYASLEGYKEYIGE